MTIDMIKGIPKSSIAAVKKAPMDVFKISKELQQGVYIINRDKVVGVIVSQEEYEGLYHLIEELEGKVLYADTITRLEEFEKDPVTYSDKEVRGERSNVNLYDSTDDEWE